jgi:hypothetical protein
VRRNGGVVGTIVTGMNLFNPDMLDRLGDMYRTEVTLYYGDSRVSTTIKDGGGRMIGTKADPRVAERVIGMGESCYGDLELSDGRQLNTLYKPFVFNGEEIFLNRLMKNSPDTILIFDEDESFIDCTDDFLRKLGAAEFDSIAGRKFSDVLKGFLDAGEIERLTGIYRTQENSNKTTVFA